MAVTIKDVAKAAGVSPQTVSNVLSGKRNVRPHTRHKVLKACEELDYTPDATARGLVTRKRHTIGLVITNIQNPVYGEIIETISEVAERYGYSIMVGVTKRNAISETKIVNMFVQQRLDGVLLASGMLDSTASEVLSRAGIPTVRILYHPERLDTDFYGSDNVMGMRLVTDHIIALGHKGIGFVNGIKSSISLQREQGFQDALKAAGLEMRKEWLIDGGFTRAKAYAATKRVLSGTDRPTALVCASDLMALGVIDAAYDLGLSIPQDLAVAGFDDIVTASIRPVSLTTVRFDLVGLAEQAILRLLAKMSSETASDGNKYHLVPCHLVIRKSSGNGPKNR
jgi:DNA-binding LacI/PurR family transcriptional regulator